MMMSSTDMRGLSAPYGSWKMICIERRFSRSSAGRSRVMSSPSKMTLPAVGASSRISSRPRVDLPQPDSPTRPSVSPGSMRSATSSTARSGMVWRRSSPPLRIGKCLVSPAASTSGVMHGPARQPGLQPSWPDLI